MSFNSRHNTAFASNASTQNEKAESRQNDAELCFLIAHYLLGGPFASIGRQLVERMNQLGFVPITHDWRHGHNVKESFASYSKLHHEINHHSLPSLVRYAAKLHASSHSRDATDFATKSKPDGQSESLTLAAPIAVAPATSAVPSVLSTSPSASIAAEQRDGRTPADTPISIVNMAAYANLVLNPSIKRLIVPGHQRVKNIYQRILRHEIGLRIVAADHPKHFMYNTLKAMKKVCGHLLPVYCTIFDRSGGMFFTGADDHLIKAWSTNSASLLRTFRGNIGEVTILCVNQANTLLATGAVSGQVRVWRIRDGMPIAVHKTHSSQVSFLSFSPLDENLLFSSGWDGYMHTYLIDPEGTSPNGTIYHGILIDVPRVGGRVVKIESAAVSPCGLSVVVGGSDGSASIRNRASVEGDWLQMTSIQCHNSGIKHIFFEKSGSQVLTASGDGFIRVWSIGSSPVWQLAGSFDTKTSGPRRMVDAVCWSLNGEFIVCSTAHFIQIWEVSTAKKLYQLSNHTQPIHVIQTVPSDSEAMITAGYDGKIIIWEIRTGRPIRIIETGDHDILELSFSPDGRYFLTGDSGGYVTLFGNGSVEPYMQVPCEQFFEMDFSPLIWDSSGWVMDRNRQMPPHLIPPGNLRDRTGTPYDAPAAETTFLDEPQVAVGVVGDNMTTPVAAPTLNQAMQEDGGSSSSSSDSGPSSSSGSSGSESEDDEYHLSGDINRAGRRIRTRLFRMRRTVNKEGEDGSSGAENQSILSDEESFSSSAKDSDSAASGNERSGNRSNLETVAITEQRQRKVKQQRITQDHYATTPAAQGRPGRRRLRAQDRTSEDEQDIDVETVEGAASLIPNSHRNASKRAEHESPGNRSQHSNRRAKKQDLHEPETSPISSVNHDKQARRRRDPIVEVEEAPGLRGKAARQSLAGIAGRRGKRIPNPSEWLTGSTNTYWGDYVPQIGDRVCFIKAGHKEFIRECKARYDLHPSRWDHPTHAGHTFIRCLVKGISYRAAAHTEEGYISLTEVLVDLEAIEFPGVSCTVTYTDTQLPSFLVLESRFDHSREIEWVPGMTVSAYFRTQDSGDWFTGRVFSINREAQQKKWQNVLVKWTADGKGEPINPWELFPGEVREFPPPVTILPEADTKRLIASVEYVCKDDIAFDFLVPVDVKLYPEYAMRFPYRIDLGIVLHRLKTNYYRTEASFFHDLDMIASNAMTFNESSSPIYKFASSLKERIVSHIHQATANPLSFLPNLQVRKRGRSTVVAESSRNPFDRSPPPLKISRTSESQSSRSTAPATTPQSIQILGSKKVSRPAQAIDNERRSSRLRTQTRRNYALDDSGDENEGDEEDEEDEEEENQSDEEDEEEDDELNVTGGSHEQDEGGEIDNDEDDTPGARRQSVSRYPQRQGRSNSVRIRLSTPPKLEPDATPTAHAVLNHQQGNRALGTRIVLPRPGASRSNGS